jgi:hypothetical protein
MTEMQVEDTPGNVDLASEALYRAEAERELDEEEELFNLEENITRTTSYNWEDKYRPRKPRYFNRVHTGYEWNKYNQTHYESVACCSYLHNLILTCCISVDNPPPKVVQGYKFNIFYPDLIDKSKAPTYKIVKEPGNDETVLLHFSAGPPYEDVAFRIVNREWEFSHKRYDIPCYAGMVIDTHSIIEDSEVPSTVDVYRCGLTSGAMWVLSRQLSDLC